MGFQEKTPAISSFLLPFEVVFTPRRALVRIPVNVTGDSGNVTDSPAKVTKGRCCAV